jgi:sulfopyruvate decarboxylase TPP-binding subunit
MYQAILQSPITLVPVCREGESMAIAAGLIMGGKRPVVLIQSTGFFESGDSIRGLCLDLHLPLLLMLGYRGYAGQGRTAADSAARYLEPVLDAWGIPYYVVDSDATCRHISEAHERAQASSHPVAVLVGREFNR